MTTMAGDDQSAEKQEIVIEEHSRRLACDRCRGQKLRCERGPASTSISINAGSCKRCLKAGAHCINSPQQPKRRYRHSQTNRERLRASRRESRGQSNFDLEDYNPREDEPDASRPMPGERTKTSTAPDQSAQESFARTSSLRKVTKNFINISSTESEEHTIRSGKFLSGYGFDTFAALSPAQSLGSSDFDHAINTGITDESWIIDLDLPPMPDLDLPHAPIESPVWDKLPHGSESFEADTSRLADAPDLTSDLSSLGSPETTDSNKRPGPWNRDDDNPSQNSDLSHLREKSIRKLYQLICALLDDIDRLESSRIIVPFSPSTSKPEDLLSAAKDLSHAVGNVLLNSERFLRIMQLYVHSGQISPSHSDDATAGRSYLDEDEHMSNYTLLGTKSRKLDQANAVPSTGRLCPDTTTTFAMLTCYTYLVKIYEGVFSQIHACLPNREARKNLLFMLPDLQLGGFQFRTHWDLQLQVLTLVSSHMISQIEQRLELLATDSTKGFMNDALFGKDQSGGLVASKALRQVIKEIKRRLGETEIC